MKTVIISIANPRPAADGAPDCSSHRHSKFVRRREYVMSRLRHDASALGNPVELFDAITDDNFKLVEGRAVCGAISVKVGSYGSMGNFLSNMALWKRSMDTGESLLILEDDALLPAESVGPVMTALRRHEDLGGNAFLYLLSECPYRKATLKSYAPEQLERIDSALYRLHDCNDIAGTAAYCVTPQAAAALYARACATEHSPTDGFLNNAFLAGAVDCRVMQQWRSGFRLHEVWESWNHDHTKPITDGGSQ